MAEPRERLWDRLDEALEAGDEGRARAAIDALLDDEPDDAEAVQELALWHTRAEALEPALATWARLAQLAPEDPLPHLGRAQALLELSKGDEALLEEGLLAVAKGKQRARGDRDATLEAHVLEGELHAALGDAEAALGAFEAALVLEPRDIEARCERGVALFELGRWEQARQALEQLLADEPQTPLAHHTLGLLAERRGEEAQASAHFARARELEPELYPEPIALSEADFDGALAQAWQRLPPYARAALENATVAVEPLPSDEELDGHLSPTMLGVFQGVPLDERSATSAADHQTARIVLFQKNLERFASSREELLEEIEITLLHEVGHLLGFDEGELKDRGLD
jgi:predicted Zn-dependent protease with MMP-like domain